jgi:hypothetical protein
MASSGSSLSIVVAPRQPGTDPVSRDDITHGLNVMIGQVTVAEVL